MHPDLPAYIDGNRDAALRLRAFIESLTDEDLGRPLEDGWTVGAALAHLAYWDRRYAELLAHNQRGEWAPDEHDMITDVQNDALLPEWRLLPPGAVRTLVTTSADRADTTIAGLPDDVVTRIVERGAIHLLRRSRHRYEHIEQIEAVLGPR